MSLQLIDEAVDTSLVARPSQATSDAGFQQRLYKVLKLREDKDGLRQYNCDVVQLDQCRALPAHGLGAIDEGL